MSRYTITLKSGKVLSDLGMNGNMFVSKTEVTKADLSESELSEVVITESGDDYATDTTVEGAVNDIIKHEPEGYMFNIREKTKEEQQAERIAELEMKNEFLEGCIMEMSEEVYK